MHPNQHLRRRRRRRDPAQGSRKMERVIWGIVALVVIVFILALGLSILGRRTGWFSLHSKSATVAASKPSRPLERTNALAQADNGLPMSERVQKWTRGARLVEEAQTLINGRRYDQALTKLLAAGELIPQSVDQMVALSRVYMNMGDFPLAEKFLARVVDADPTRIEARQMLAKALIENGKNLDALAVAEWICAGDGYSEEGHEIAAAAALNLNESAKAIEHLKKLLSLKGDDMTVKNNLGIAYLRAGSYTEARKTFEDILRTDEQHSTAHYNLAVCLIKLGDTKQAIITLNRAAARLGDGYVGAWLNMPDFDSVRANPDFIALQKSVGSAPPPDKNPGLRK